MRLSTPGPTKILGARETIHKPPTNEYAAYHQNKLMSANDVEREPGPARFRKPLILHILIVLAIILMKNIITENMQPKQCSISSTVNKSEIRDDCAKTTRSMKNMKTQMKAKSKHLPKLLLARAGDIHPNPGPNDENLCLNCKRNVSKSQSVICNTCNGWSHLNCSASPGDNDICILLDKSFEWLCPNPTCTPNHHTGLSEHIPSTANRFNTQELDNKKTRKRKSPTKTSKRPKNNDKKDPNLILIKELTKISPSDYIGKDKCKACLKTIGERQKAISCDQCNQWTHLNCSDMSKKTYNQNENKLFHWICNTCRTPDETVTEKMDINKLTPQQMPIFNHDFKQNDEKDILIFHYNCRSMINKTAELFNICKLHRPAIICVTETWLDETSPANAYVPDGYRIIRYDRSDAFKQKYGKNNGGGIAIIYQESIKIQKLNIETELEETLWVDIKARKNITLGVVYRPNYTDLLKDQENGTILESQLTEATYINSNLIVVGDFNCDTEADCQDKDTKVLNEVFNSQSMKQLITKPTRIDTKNGKATTIDHVWTNPEKNLVKETGTIEGISDHVGVYVKVNTAKENAPPEISRFRSYKNYQPDAFNQELQENLSSDTLNKLIEDEKVDEATEMWIKIFKDTADKHAPIKVIKKTKKRKFIPWFTTELENLLMERQRKIQLCGLYGLISDRTAVKVFTNKINHLKRKCKKQYYRGKIKEYDGDPKKMWKVLKEVTQTEKKQSTTEPDFMDQKTANSFNSFFSTVGCKLQKRLGIKTDSGKPTTNENFRFKEETEETILKLIDRIRTDVAVGEDDISAKLLKDAKFTVAKSLTRLINISYRTSIFPACMKKATVKAIHKKDDTQDPSNYRPLSILSVISKVFERSATDQLASYLEQNNLLNETQHAYRKQHSTVTCLSEVTNHIYKENDRGYVVAIVSMDLSKAFDSINHEQLIHKLAKLGLGTQSLEWCQSYLHNRSQKTKFKNFLSTEETVTSGVPQGSILGPILFICFTNDMAENFQSCKTVSYADDTQIIVSANNLKELKEKIEELINTAQKWYTENSLCINPSKTEVMIIRKRNNQEKIDIQVTEEGKRKTIKLKTEIKVLGVFLDENMNWDKQVRVVNKKARNATINLQRVNHLVPFKSRLILYNSLVACHFNYADIVWGGCSKQNQNKLQRTQNLAVKSMLGLKREESSESALQTANLLPLNQKRKVHEAVFIKKGLAEKQPAAINREYKQQLSLKNNRSGERRLLTIPKHRTQMYENSTLYRTIKTWNSLPQILKDQETETSSFKKAYQKHLQKAATY